ncbi:PucR family transcriptional regulator ligand-binding domain-containing protein [Roseburia hominis]
MITVHDVMGMFKDFSVLAGEEALDKELTNVTVVDAPDIGIWIKGGEFVLSTAYAFQNNIEQ